MWFCNQLLKPAYWAPERFGFFFGKYFSWPVAILDDLLKLAEYLFKNQVHGFPHWFFFPAKTAVHFPPTILPPCVSYPNRSPFLSPIRTCIHNTMPKNSAYLSYWSVFTDLFLISLGSTPKNQAKKRGENQREGDIWGWWTSWNKELVCKNLPVWAHLKNISSWLRRCAFTSEHWLLWT